MAGLISGAAWEAHINKLGYRSRGMPAPAPAPTVSQTATRNTGTGTSKSTTTSTTTGTSKKVYDEPLPEAPKARVYDAPEYDDSRVSRLTQREAAGDVNKLRRNVQMAMGSSSDYNPNVNKMTLRAALAGYGQGLESVMRSAGKRAEHIYGKEFGAESEEAKAGHDALVRQDDLDHDKNMAKWRASERTVNTNKTVSNTVGTTTNNTNGTQTKIDSGSGGFGGLTKTQRSYVTAYGATPKYKGQSSDQIASDLFRLGVFV